MRCACPNCGAFMPQSDTALQCTCPDCGHACAACLGQTTQPLSIDAIRARAALSMLQTEDENDGLKP